MPRLKNPIDWFREKYHYGRYEKIKKWVSGPCRLLDVGCGRPCPSMEDGAFIKYLGFGTGLDLKKHEGFDSIEGDAVHIPFNDNTFNVVTALEVLEHVEDLDAALLEIKRVLAPGGTLILSTPTNNLIWRIVWPLWEKTFGRMWKDAHKQALTKKEWLRMVGKHFRVSDLREYWGLVFIAKMTNE